MIRAAIAATLTVAVVIGGFVYGALGTITAEDGWPDDE